MAQAELTHGSFYRYFDSKEELAVEALSRALDGFEALLLARACRGQPLSDEVLRASRALVAGSNTMNVSGAKK